MDEQFSVNVGAACVTPSGSGWPAWSPPDVLRGALGAIAADLSRIEGRPPPDAWWRWVARITNIAVKHGLSRYDPNVVQGSVLDRVEIDRQIEMYRSRDAAERRSIVGLQPKRADVILAGVHRQDSDG